MTTSYEEPMDNTEVVDIELDISAARLWQFLNINKNVTIKDLQDNYAEIITQKLKDLLPPESAARLGIRITLGRLQRQGKIEVFHDDNTNEDKVYLAGERIKTKWMSALRISPNAL